MWTPTRILFTVGILAAAAGVAAQNGPTPPDGRTVTRINVKPIRSADGHDNFQAYCAPCHGADAKGTGPAAKSLDVPPADLTLIAARHGGTFEQTHVYQALRGNHSPSPLTAMPDWEHMLRSVCRSDGELQLRLTNLVRYIESIQQP